MIFLLKCHRVKKLLLYFSILFLLVNVEAQNRTPLYSFFSAGHTYGNPMSPQYGLHPPFVEYIPAINNYPNIVLGVLTGDVVLHPTADYWDSAQIDIDKLNMPVRLAAGNHDMGSEFVNRFGDYYYSFTHNNDLFIVLTPGLDSWNIVGDQLEFLSNTLDSNSANVNNIFIFMHELIWWSPDNEYQNVIINYEPHYPGSTNFDAVVKPLLLSYPNKITIYAGDVGATAQVSPFMYHSFANITLIASGMGGGIRDNIIITEVYEDSVYYNLLAINGDNPKALGELTDYSLYSSISLLSSNQIQVFPNPCNHYFSLENKLQSDLTMEIYNVYGQLIMSKPIFKHSNNEIEIANLKPGIYVLMLFGQDAYYEQKLIVQ